MSKLRQLIHEIHRRSLWQILGIYLVGSWLVLQAVDTLAGALNLPDWAPPFALFLLIIGFPIVLATAFVQEGTARTAPEQAGNGADRSGVPDRATQHRLFTWRNAILGGVGAALLWGGFAAGWFLFGRGPVGAPIAAEAPGVDLRSIAVLPFSNRAADEGESAVFFAEGIHDDILTHLSKIGSLTVISRTSVMQYAGTTKPMREIAGELGVATVLEGGVQRAGDRVRVNVQLIDAATDRHLWAETYDEELTTANIFAIQSDIARKIAAALQATLAPEVEELIEARPTESLEAYDLYTRGRYIENTASTAAGVEEATDLFRRAIEADPGYAPAYVGLANAYGRLWGGLGVVSGEEALPKMRAAAERALELDEDFAEAHAVLGWVLTAELRYAEAEREYLRALELNPGSADVHLNYASFLTDVARYKEAVRHARRAVELDPISIGTRVGLAARLFFTRNYDDVIDEALRILELQPENAGGYYFLGAAYALQGRHEEAIAALQRSIELDPESPTRLVGLAWVYARDRQREKALELLKDLPEQGSTLKEIAIVYGELGELDRAFEYLDRAYAEDPGTLNYIRADPSADSLKDDPRFAELMRKMGLE